MNPLFAGLVAIVMWSVSAVLIVHTQPIPAFELGFLTLFMAFVFLNLQQWLAGRDLREGWRISPKAYALGIFGIGGYVSLWYLGFKFAPPFEANLLNYLWPLLLVVFSSLLDKRPPAIKKTIGVLMGFSGCLLIFKFRGLQSLASASDDTVIFGLIFAFSGALVWAVYSSLTRFVAFPSTAMSPFFLVSSLICLVLHFVFEQTVFPSASAFLALVLLAMTRSSFLFWDYAMKRGQVSSIAAAAYFIPLLSTGLLMFAGQTPTNSGMVISALLIVGGCLVSNVDAIRESLDIQHDRAR